MEVKLTLDLSDRFIGCLDAAVEALKGLGFKQVDSATAVEPLVKTVEAAPVRKRAAEKVVKEVAPVSAKNEQASAKDDIELADLRVYLKKLWDAGHKDSIDTLFKSYEATGLKDLDPTKYNEVFQDLKEIIKAYEL